MSLVQGRWIGSIFEQEVPTGLINGSNVTFSLSTFPHSSKAVLVILDGLILRQTSDYSISGSTITLVNAPVAGQQIYALYVKKG